ncbi:hypothetical protein RB195_023306 [Necator americanus]|uniref:Integrase catalytic domain-containing protein n=1 Tax=Necator americanus TaxID=51031 RepID=A0ABR1EIL3_NECAM
MTAEANMWNNKTSQYERVLIFFDTGAQRTIINERTAEEFGLPKQKTEICTMSGIGGHTEKFKTFFVPLKISTVFGKEIHLTVQTKPVITNGFRFLLEQDKQFLQNNDICLSNPRLRGEHQNLQILIGLDYYYEFVMSSTRTRLPSGLYVARTLVGPTLHGRSTSAVNVTSEEITHILTLVQQPSEADILQKIFELEGLGISSNEFSNDEKTFEYFEKYSRTISFKNSFVTAPFPLKDNAIDISDNYAMAYRRLEFLQRQLVTNKEQRSWYSKIFNDYLKDSIIEEVHEPVKNAADTYYMPHSGVWKPSKTKPLRIVFDASSKQRGKLSLNDVIHTGESFVNKIHDILIRSRISKFILTCDIEAAFTQIRIVNNHKDLCRFLWVKDISRMPTKDNIVVYRFNRLPFGVTASPSILNIAILAYLCAKNTPLSHEIARNIYVDNILLTTAAEQEALKKYVESKNIFKEIGMNLREYVSNSQIINEGIHEKDRSPSGDIKFLGVKYNTETDQFNVKVNIPSKTSFTKRDVVSIINSVYDPIGVTALWFIKMKSIMRKIYDIRIKWNDYVNPVMTSRWNTICKEINGASISIPRSILTEVRNLHTSKTDLWISCDASNLAISSCAFLRHNDTNEVTQLISGKSKLTPKKCRQTTPRLKLLGIVIGMRLGKSVLENLDHNIDHFNLVTDSEIALQWINSSRKLPAFIINQKDRIEKIKSQVGSKGISVNFFHVPTHNNPADAGTRGLTSSQLDSHIWVKGPQWLALEPSSSKLRSIDTLNGKEIMEEMETFENPHVEESESNNDNANSMCVDLSRFSRFKTALRTVSRVAKVLHKWINRCNTTRLTSTAISTVSRFDPDSLIDCEEMRLNTKMPIYIDNDSDLARLIIIDLHCNNAHCGKDHILSLARQKYWIPQPSRAIKKYIKDCTICKRCQGRWPFGAPEIPPLPSDRVTISKPIQNVGCDFMGSFLSNRNERMYICLYTCLAIRAIHLEVVESLTIRAFLNSFIRFVSRRGVPLLMRTDCGSNSKLGQKIIEKLFESDETTENPIMNYCASEGIKWIFNPPASPWMGGVWKRLVGSVKRSFQKSVGRKKLSFEQMATVLTRIEAIINTRPLTKLTATDLSEIPLRPIDFLQGNFKFSILNSEMSNFRNDPTFEPELIQAAAQAYEALASSENFATKFWEKWNTEYLTILRDSHRCQLNQKRHRPVNEIYPLEIRSEPDNQQSIERSSEIMDNDIHIPTTTQSRNHLARISKSRALDVIREFETDLDRSMTPTSARSTVSCLITAMLSLFLINPIDAQPNNSIICNEDITFIIPPRGQFELCFDHECKSFKNVTEEIRYTLPVPPLDNPVTVEIRFYLRNEVIAMIEKCERHEFCAASSTILSKALLENPHCWPFGAILTVFIILYSILVTMIGMAWSIRKCRKQRQRRTNVQVECELKLDMASKYPGYIACEETCGGTVCGCLLPMPVCSFLRLAQVPSKQRMDSPPTEPRASIPTTAEATLKRAVVRRWVIAHLVRLEGKAQGTSTVRSRR